MSFPVTGTASYELAATLATESVAIAAGVVHGPVPLGPLDNCVLGTAVRCIRLTVGAAALIEKRLQGEAFILGRSLFEDSLRMAEIAYDAIYQKGLLLDWHFASLTELQNVHAEAQATGLDITTWRDMPTKIARWRQELNVLAHREQIKRKRFRSVKEAAKRFGRVHDYWVYQFAHELVHGSDISHSLYRLVDPPMVGLPTNVYASTDVEAPLLATACANWCARSLLQAAGAAAVVFRKDPRDADAAFACSNRLEEFLHERSGLGQSTPQPAPPPRT